MAEAIRLTKYLTIRNSMNLDEIANLKEEIAELKSKIGVLMREIISMTLELHKERKGNKPKLEAKDEEKK